MSSSTPDGRAADGGRSASGLVVLSQNAWGGAALWSRRRLMLAQMLRRLRPDIVGLQEIRATGEVAPANQAAELAEMVGGYDVRFVPARSAGREGVALLSRHPISAFAAAVLGQDRRDPLDCVGPRVVLHAVVEHPLAPIDVFVTHLSLSRKARRRNLAELAEWSRQPVRNAPGRLALLLGDLNATPAERPLEYLRGRRGLPATTWVDAWQIIHSGSAAGRTWPACCPWRRLDYVLVRLEDRWSIAACDRAPPAGSDHRGVLCRLEFAPQPAIDADPA